MWTVNKQMLYVFLCTGGCDSDVHTFDMRSDIKRKYKIALGIQRRDIAKLCSSFGGKSERVYGGGRGRAKDGSL